jgi:DNA-binding MarR family transcriptional regulator
MRRPTEPSSHPKSKNAPGLTNQKNSYTLKTSISGRTESVRKQVTIGLEVNPIKKVASQTPARALEQSVHRKPSVLDEQRLLRLVGFNIVRADIRLRSDFLEAMSPLGLRPAEFSALILILDNPEITQKHLGQSLRISPPNMATMLDRMVERGWIKRERSITDRRAQHPQLTEAGKELALKAATIAETLEDDALSVLSAGERLILIEMLQKIVRGKHRHA